MRPLKIRRGFNAQNTENSRFSPLSTLRTQITAVLTMKDMKVHEEKPGNAALLSGFKAFRLWRPTPRRWITPGGPPVAN